MQSPKTKMYAVVVLYNKNYRESVTIGCLKNTKDVNVIVCDNSTKDYNNSIIAKELGYSYINMNGNKGLSKAYNRSVETIGEEDGYICFFDDDTFLPGDYFITLKKAIESERKDIYLPFVYDDLGLLSPCKITGAFIRRVNSIDKLNARNITGINSGMAVNLEVFKEGIRYNENYFLDCVDHDFIRSMKDRKKSIGFFNTRLNQRFSGNDFKDKEQTAKRFTIYKKDFEEFSRKIFLGRIFFIFVIMKRALKMTLKFKDLGFLLRF